MIREYVEEDKLDLSESFRSSTPFMFLQLPSSWPTPMLVNYWNGKIRRIATFSDKWLKPRGLEIKFRQAIFYRHRKIVGSELGEERCWLPGVEVEPALKSNLSTRNFTNRLKKRSFSSEYWSHSIIRSKCD